MNEWRGARPSDVVKLILGGDPVLLSLDLRLSPGGQSQNAVCGGLVAAARDGRRGGRGPVAEAAGAELRALRTVSGARRGQPHPHDTFWEVRPLRHLGRALPLAGRVR